MLFSPIPVSDILGTHLSLSSAFILALCIILDIIFASLFTYIHIIYKEKTYALKGKEYPIKKGVYYYIVTMIAFIGGRLLLYVFSFSKFIYFIIFLCDPIIAVLSIYVIARAIFEAYKLYDFKKKETVQTENIPEQDL